LPELSVKAFLTLLDKLLVAELLVLGNIGTDGALFTVVANDTNFRVAAVLRLLHLFVFLYDGVVGDNSSLSTFEGRTLEEKGALENVVPANGVVTLDNLGV
jgi:hypothetical protein